MPVKRPKPLVLANWKMNLSVAQSVKLSKSLVSSFTKKKLADRLTLGLAPTFPALAAVAETLKRKPVMLGAQDIFWKPAGPFTGEVSSVVLKELGASFVIIGHSERRQYMKETDEMVHQKVQAALTEGLMPVVCVGETFAQRQSGQKDLVVSRQVQEGLRGVELASEQQLIIAYEPVWVIGSGQAVEPAEAQDTAKVIVQSLIDIMPTSVIERQVRIIYGGSVDTSNIQSFLSRRPLSGVLVGGASLEAKRFIELMSKL